jgi:uncharacterized protein (TIGR03032 family)
MTDQPTNGEPQSEKPQPEEPQAAESMRRVDYEHSTHWLPLLESLNATLLVSTYQAGKLAVISATDGKLHLSLHNFEQAMGVAVGRDTLAVGTRQEIWFLPAAHELSRRLEPPGTYDACYTARRAHYTGQIHVHEMRFAADGQLWIVNTLFSCLCTLHDAFSFVPRWQPKFIDGLAPEDRCHLNGMALEDGRPRYVTTMSETNVPQGWRPNKSTAGCVIDVASSETVARGLAMPHSPRLYQGKLWVLNSGCGHLSVVDPRNGQIDVVEQVPVVRIQIWRGRDLRRAGHRGKAARGRIRPHAASGQRRAGVGRAAAGPGG